MTLSVRQRAAINTVGITGSQGAAFLAGLFVLPFMIGHLGKDDFGIYQLVRSFLGYLPLLTLSTGPAIARYVTYAVGKNDRESVNRFMSNGLAAVLGVVSVFLLAGCLLSVFLPRLTDPGSRSREIQWLVILLTAASAMSFLQALYNTPLYSQERLAEQAGIEVTADLFRTAAIVGSFLIFSPRLIWIGAAALAGELLSTAIAVRCAYRVFPWLRLSTSLVDRSSLTQLTTFSLFSTLGSLVTAIYYSTDYILIKWLYGTAGPGLIAVYTVGASWDPWLRGAFLPLIRIVVPRMILLSAQERSADLKRLTILTVRYATALVVPVCVLISVYAEPILSLWMGGRLMPEELRTAAALVPLLLIPLILTLGMSPSSAVFLAESRIAAPAWASLSGALMKLCLSVTLATAAGWGLNGIAAGTGLALALYALVFIPLYLKRVCGLEPRDLFISALLGPCCLATLLAVMGWILKALLAPHRLVPLLMVMSACTLGYALGAYRFVLFPRERDIVAHWIQRILQLRRGGGREM